MDIRSDCWVIFTWAQSGKAAARSRQEAVSCEKVHHKWTGRVSEDKLRRQLNLTRCILLASDHSEAGSIECRAGVSETRRIEAIESLGA